jgi:hypothetical protein
MGKKYISRVPLIRELEALRDRLATRLAAEQVRIAALEQDLAACERLVARHVAEHPEELLEDEKR